jgi:hypothetical protein
MSKQIVEVKIGIVPSGNGGAGTPVTAEQAKIAREEFGYEATQIQTGVNKGYFELTKKLEMEFPDTTAECEAWILTANATDKSGKPKTIASILQAYVDKFYKNKEAASLFARIQGKDSDMTKKFRGTIIAFFANGALDLEKLDKAIAESSNPSDRFNEDFWKTAVSYAVSGSSVDEIIANLQ